jgi:hypothetical protein
MPEEKISATAYYCNYVLDKQTAQTRPSATAGFTKNYLLYAHAIHAIIPISSAIEGTLISGQHGGKQVQQSKMIDEIVLT